MIDIKLQIVIMGTFLLFVWKKIFVFKSKPSFSFFMLLFDEELFCNIFSSKTQLVAPRTFRSILARNEKHLTEKVWKILNHIKEMLRYLKIFF